MAGNGDRAAAAGERAGWLGRVFETLKGKIEEAVAAVEKADPPGDVAGAEKLARAVGVIARAARAVAALEPRLADSEEDEMGERTYDPEEDERLRRELAAHYDRLDGIIERKRARDAERRAAEAGAAQGDGEGSPGPADAG